MRSIALIFGCAACSLIAGAADDVVDFDREVRPILVANCYQCHGPHDQARKAGLRFDRAQDAMALLRSNHHAIVPSQPNESEMLQRVREQDIDKRMPPQGHNALSEQQINTLHRWISQGAQFTSPWAFQPRSIGTPPDVHSAAWCHGDVDQFVIATREAAGLTAPKDDLDPAALLRKLSFDLRGLPPSPQDVRDFVNQPQSYEQWVDRYLADTAFGERWGRHWLDLARYAETLGHEFDYEMPDAWRYRDYVIAALNEDLPIDQFVAEQLAGDLIAPRAALGLNNAAPIATAWWFLGPAVHAPVDVRQDEADRTAGIVDVLGRSFFGLSVACARCHDHKFDPIPTADFYAIAGVVRNTRRVMGFIQTDSHADDFLRQAVEACDRASRAAAVHATTRDRGATASIGITALDDLTDCGASWKKSGSAFSCGIPVIIANADGSMSASETGTIDSGRLDRKLVGSARSLVGEINQRYLHVRVRGSDCGIRAIIDNYWLDERNPLLFENLLRRLAHQDGTAEWKTETFDLGRFIGERMYLEFIDDGDGSIEVDWIASSDDAVAPDAAQWDIDGVATATSSENALSEIHGARASIDQLMACTPPIRAMIAEEGGTQDEAIHLRGAAHSPGAVSPRARLAMIPTSTTAQVDGSGRMALAKLLGDPANPFLWRTTANRVWLKLFGRGIVETPDDFGQLGSPAWSAHLLDALASQLARDRSIKSLIRTVVLSHAYRAVADADEAPSTAWAPLAARRLDAESIRDSMLAASGRLNRKGGGPSVPAHLSEQMQGRGRPSESGPVDGDGRRSVYLAVRRNFLDPFMQAFDSPVPSTTCGRRHSSNVPAQSLAMLNSELVDSLGAYWGEQIVQSDVSNDASRIESMWYAAYSRAPRTDELSVAQEFLAAERAVQSSSDVVARDRAAYGSLARCLFATKEFIFLR